MPDSAMEPIDTLGEYRIRRNTIPDYCTEEFAECFNVWSKWNAKNMLPHSGGWYEQPAHVVDVCDMFDQVYGQWYDETH